MEWPSQYNGHNVVIDEITTEQQGVVALLAKCLSCRQTLGAFGMENYPKYRLAMAAARESIIKHVSSPFDEQDGVW